MKKYFGQTNATAAHSHDRCRSSSACSGSNLADDARDPAVAVALNYPKAAFHAVRAAVVLLLLAAAAPAGAQGYDFYPYSRHHPRCHPNALCEATCCDDRPAARRAADVDHGLAMRGSGMGTRGLVGHLCVRGAGQCE